MKKLYNERHAHLENIPSDLMVLEELNKREALDETLKRRLHYFDSKETGLMKVLDILNKYGKEDWMYMHNVAVDYYDIITCDLLVMTSTHVYTFEINEYEGTFELKNGISKLDGQTLKEHPIAMAQSVLTQLQGSKRMAPVPIKLKLKAAAVFTHSNNPLEIHDEVSGIEIVSANQIENYVKRMVREEKQAQAKGVTFNPMYFSWVARIDRHHPCIEIEIPDAVMEKVRPGILCTHCGGFDVKIGEVLMTCECGGWELVEEAIIRTICEYAILIQGKNIHLPSLCEFFDNQIPKVQLEKCLDKVYEVVM